MLFNNFEKFVDKYGYATAAAFLGHRDTGAVKNWIARKTIPTVSEYSVEDLVENIKTHPVKMLKDLSNLKH